MPHANTAQAASATCQSCGLCCAGLLFAKVSVYEKDKAARTLLSLAPDNLDKHAMPQPCQFLEGAACTIYADRPRNCRGFSCLSRDRVLNESLSLDEALQIIQSAKDAMQLMEQPVQDYQGISIAKTGFRPFCDDFIHLIRYKLDHDDMPTQAEYDILVLAFNVTKIVDRHFRETSRLNMFAEAIMAIEFLNAETS